MSAKLENTPIVMIKDDITVILIPDNQCECDEAQITHAVAVDFRGAGVITDIFRGCFLCCEEYAERIRETLPDNQSVPNQY